MSSSCYLANGWLWVRPPRYPSLECRDIGGRWIAKRREWRFPARIVSLVLLHEVYPTLHIDDAVREALEPSTAFVERPGDAAISNSLARLRAYQRDAIGFIEQARSGALLALAPRLGKAVCSLCAAARNEMSNVLIVATKSVMSVWREEAEEWVSRTLQIVHKRPLDGAGWVVTSYDTMVQFRKSFERPWDVVIFDESVLLKSRKTKRRNAALAVRRQAQRCWLLTGSSTTRHADDLWAQFNLIDAAAFTSYWRHANHYCTIDPDYGTVTGTKERYSVADDHRDVMFVRSQQEVLPELPEYLFQSITVELTERQRRAHDDMLNDFVTKLGGSEVTAAYKITQIQRLQQITSNLCNLGPGWPDESAKADAIEELLESEDVDLPVVIWMHWKGGGRALRDRLLRWRGAPRTEIIDGDVSEAKREQIRLAFQAGEVDVLILGLSVGKFGLDLSALNTAISYDRNFNADDFVQSLERGRHIERTNRPVWITLSCADSADDLVSENQEGKLPDIAKISNADLAVLLCALGKSQ